MRGTIIGYAALLAIGVSWGMTMPMTKLAVSTGHAPLGIIVWQFAIVAALLGAVMALTRIPLPRDAPALRYYAVIAFIGTIVPNSFSFLAAAQLPAGIMAIVIATVPIWALAIALVLVAFGPLVYQQYF